MQPIPDTPATDSREDVQRVVTTEHCTLYLGDCLDVLPTLGKVDAVVTDPPYGIGEAAGKNKTRTNAAVARDYGDLDWDDVPCSPEQIAAMRAASKWQIIFGGNYFALPPSRCWLVWDKLSTGDFADCELAWTNLDRAVRRLQHLWNGMIRKDREERFHPTQKPLELMVGLVEVVSEPGHSVLDPFMGSGTTGVACINTGRRFIGIEKESKYFDIAVRRIREAERMAKCDLFKQAKPVEKQGSLL